MQQKKPAANPRVNTAELEYIEQDNNDENQTTEQQASANEFDNKKIPFWTCFAPCICCILTD